MADAAVALNAINFVSAAMTGDLADELAMAAETILLHNHSAAGPHLDRLVKVLEGKPVGMPEAVFSFGQVFSDNVMGHMAGVAGGEVFVAGFDPAIELLTHDMAIHTGFGIIRKVGRALRVDKGVTAEANGQPDHPGQQEKRQSRT
jgi:hypothetical protein